MTNRYTPLIFVTMIANESHLPLKIRTVRLQQIADAAGVPIGSILSKKRYSVLIACRVIYTEILRKKGLSLHQIGERINRDHATVIFYLQKWAKNEDYHKIKEKLEL